MGNLKHEARRPASESQVEHPSDQSLRKRIESHVSPASRNGHKTGISVEVKDGFVELKGVTRTFRNKERLHRFVMGLKGVRALKDQVQVQPSESIADRDIALHVRQALDAHSELPPGTAVVHVAEGICTLKGHVCSAEERHVAENVARHCRGVKSVVNEVTVNPLDEISDEATARAVKSALAYCMEGEIEAITVSCSDGHVILRGLVPTLMDRSMAEEVTRIQFGVRSVENHIQVASHTQADPVTLTDNARANRSRRVTGRGTPKTSPAAE